jgi:hypothetical protein
MKVLAKDAKAGQWYQDNNGQRFLCCDGRRLWTPEGETWNAHYDLELTHLPDCTGWDWQPPKPEKKYRAFATWQEWWPHRDRWVRMNDDRMKLAWYNKGFAGQKFDRGAVFLNDDGTDAEPFGVEVKQ